MLPSLGTATYTYCIVPTYFYLQNVLCIPSRPVQGVRGFTRETLSAVIVDIESRKWRLHYNNKRHIPPENPRTSTSDDVECFFSVLRDTVGWDITHKEVYT